MPGSSRRRKRGKPESDDDNTAQAGPSTALSENKPSTAAQAVAKRRRLDLETSPALPFSSPAPVVATPAPTLRQRNRSRAATAKQSTSLASNTSVDAVVKEELHDDHVSNNAQPPLDSSLQRRSPGAKATSDTSSLSTLSDHDVLNDVKKEEPDEVIPAFEEAPSIATSKEPVAETTAEPARHYTRAEKGKGRAKSPQANQHLRAEAARLEAELAKLRGELTTATSTIENHQAFLTKVSEALTCNICLETLHLPLALTCGHVFCQDDLWNWFHRESADSESDDDDGSSGSSSGSEDDDDEDSSTSEDDAPAPGPSRVRRGGPGTVARPVAVDSDNSDLVPVEDDYNTDDPLDDSTSSKSPSPVAVRRGVRIQTTRGQQVAEQVAATGRFAVRRNNATSSNAPTGPPRQRSPIQVNDAAPGPSTAGTPGCHTRVPPLARPNRSNLVCPQCRSRVSLPPFPIFAVRAVSDLLTAQVSGRRAGSIDAERENNGITDPTWGGLFPRAANDIGRSGRWQPLARPMAGAATPWRLRAEARRAQEAQRQEVGRENAIALSSDSESSNSSSAESDSGSLDELRNQVRQSQRTGEDLTREQRTRAELHNLFSDDRSSEHNLATGEGSRARPFFNGQHRREEAEHLLVNDRSRRNRLDLLTATRDERRRLHRRAGRAAVTGTEEAQLRDTEDRAIATVRRELLLSRAERAQNHASSSRGRDILRHGIRDAEDGVRRCIDCNWEIENGKCEHCGAVYDSESEFDDNGEDIEGEVTSPARPTQEASEMSFIERDGPSDQGHESFTDGTEDEGEDLMDSEDGSEADTAASVGDTNEGTSERRGKRKVNRFMYDSEEEDELDEEGEGQEDSFVVADNEVEHIGTSEGDDLLDDEDEAEETDREEKRARREERRQAKEARRLQIRQAEGSSSGYSSSDADEDEDSSSSDDEESGPLQSNSLTSPSVKDEEEDNIPTISSQKVRREMQERVKKAKSTLSAREQAAKAAMSRNSRLEVPDTAKSGTSAAESQGSTASAIARKKRVIEASDEE